MILLFLPLILVSWVAIIESPNDTLKKKTNMGEDRERVERRIDYNL